MLCIIATKEREYLWIYIFAVVDLYYDNLSSTSIYVRYTDMYLKKYYSHSEGEHGKRVLEFPSDVWR